MPVGPGARYSVCVGGRRVGPRRGGAWGLWGRALATRLGWRRRLGHPAVYTRALCSALGGDGGGCSVRGGAMSTLYSIAALWAGDLTAVVRNLN